MGFYTAILHDQKLPKSSAKTRGLVFHGFWFWFLTAHPLRKRFANQNQQKAAESRNKESRTLTSL
jgi:hypothetical protein